MTNEQLEETKARLMQSKIDLLKQQKQREHELHEALVGLQKAQQKYNIAKTKLDDVKLRYGQVDRELAEIDGRLKHYYMNGSEKKPTRQRAKKSPATTQDLIEVLKSLPAEELAKIAAGIIGN
jgi:NAD-dependent SIR2 family protein deacetylase